MEASTSVFLKIHFHKVRQNTEKIPVKEFTFTKVAGFRPLLQAFFKNFAKIKSYFSLNFQNL